MRGTAAAGILTVLLLCGCQGQPRMDPDTDPLVAVPVDFTLDVTVMVHEDLPGDPSNVHRRPGKFILFPDGILHSDTGEGVSFDTRPAQTRTLHEGQVAQVWSLVRSLGFADRSRADSIGNPALEQIEPDQILHVITVTADSRRWSYLYTFEDVEPADAASTRLIRVLARLGWEREMPGAASREPVWRFDFGPDPYATLRTDDSR
ncbi:MAG: hypothetical protein CMJ32_08815 [Phycisphaerae bacterium]|nr:hypothetical protein [Phycisphaerae bacterium]